MKFLVIDDHPIFRQGMAALLGQLHADAEVLQCGDGAEALEQAAAASDLDLVLVDLRMQGADGLMVLQQLGRRRPGLPVLVVSSSEEPEDVRRCLAAGARGYCPKSSSPATLRLALDVVLSGDVYMPPMLAPEAAPVAPQAARVLTPRQQQVLQALCRGLSNKEIARELGMEEPTVKGHVSAAFRALNVVNRTQAVDAARRAGLLST